MRRAGLAAGVLLGASAWWATAALLAPEETWRVVERRDLVLTVPIEGELRSSRSVSLGPPQIDEVWQFKIARLATEGEEVAEGEVVVAFDPTELQQRLLRETAERDQAEAELEKKVTDLQIQRRDAHLEWAEAQARLRRAEFELGVPEEVIARHELEAARIDRRLALLEIESIEGLLRYLDVREELEIGTLRSKRDVAASEVERLERDLVRLEVRAPRSGTLLFVGDWQGEDKKVGDTVWRMEEIAEIPDLAKMEARAEVAEGDAGRIAVGQSVLFRLDAYPDREVGARITRIRRTVQAEARGGRGKVVEVRLELVDSDPERFRPGMRFEGGVEIDRRRGVVVVPEDAVATGPEGVWVLRDGPLGTERVVPELGARDDRGVEVLSGLEPGDRVLARPAEAAR